MIKVMSFSCGVRTQLALVWVSIIWFTSAVSVAVSQSVKLHTISQVETQCGGNATLTCKATSSKQFDIKLFSWVASNKTVCQYKDSQPGLEDPCERTDDTPNHTLTLTLLNVMPVNQGEYLCKLRTNLGIASATTFITVQDCIGSSSSSYNESHAECLFSEVYPSGIVHWFQGDDDLTDSTRTHEEKDQHGRYSVWSTIDKQKRDLSQPYNCSLWIPSARKYLSSELLYVAGAQRASGSIVKLQWICIMVEIMMATFMT